MPWVTFLNWYWLPLFPMFVIFYVSALAETNRRRSTVEANPSWSPVHGRIWLDTLSLFMLGEYVADHTMCAMATIMFLGGWLPPVALPPFTWVPA